MSTTKAQQFKHFTLVYDCHVLLKEWQDKWFTQEAYREQAARQLITLISTVTNWDALVTIWKNIIGPNSGFRQNVEEQMALIASTITDWDTLLTMLGTAKTCTIPQHIIQEQMATILPNLLPTITDWDTLKTVWEIYEYSRTNIVTNIVQNQIEDRMATILPDLLPTITDWDTLLSMSYYSLPFNSSLYAQFFDQMSTVLTTATDWHTLETMKLDAKVNTHHQLITDLMMTILPGLLPTVSDWSVLLSMHQLSSKKAALVKRIEKRMIEVISTIEPDNIPDWFISQLIQPISWLHHPARISFEKKVEELKTKI